MLKSIRVSSYAILLGIFLFVGLSGCNQQTTAKKFHSTDITGVDFGKDFKLTDHTGKVRTLADFKGKVVVMFFGYTHCPDVCPTTMSDMAQALNILGKDANKVQVLFVTVDPERDTQELLAKYVPAFNPGFLGLYGDEAATARVAKDFRVFYQKHQGKGSQGYDVDHTAGTYVFDQSGKLRLFMSYGQSAEISAQDLRALFTD
ncbi:MAG TPA: SCO family protein [Gallionellaceae bacterium]|nr:SCO family protein [Gallionellaceae bacterium]